MRAGTAGRVAAFAALATLVAACGGQVSDKYTIEDPPYVLEDVEGSDLKIVLLEPQAVVRLGIATAPVESVDGALTVPSGALWMDVEGVFWVYMNTAPNTYLRHQVAVVDDDGTRAALASGPTPGTDVVVLGVPELYGTEVGVGK